MKSLDIPRGGIIYADPLFSLAEELKEDASAFRRSRKEHPDAEILESIAARLLDRIAAATTREWLSTDEAAALLGKKPDTIRSLCRNEKIRCMKRGGEWLVHRSSVEH